MTGAELSYFNKLCECIENKWAYAKERKLLLNCLYQTSFFYVSYMDKNRLYDGLDLRYRFNYLPANNDCSVLEMMVALAINCEERIMRDDIYGDRTSNWFWYMIYSLGLFDMDDDNFNMEYVNKRLYTFLNREYDYDGRGSLFYIPNSSQDLRNIEIWYQMQMYLNEVIKNE